MKVNKLYSPRQSTMAAFFGGPLAAVYVVRNNYTELGKEASARSAIAWGSLLVLALLLVLPFLPEKFPNTAIPLAYSLAVGQLVEKLQLSKEAIRESEQYDFESNWRVAGVSVLSLLLFLVLMVAWMFLLDFAGVISLA
jgi:hypothetical protein